MRYRRIVVDKQLGGHYLNGNGYTTGLQLEVKVSDVEYESEETTY